MSTSDYDNKVTEIQSTDSTRQLPRNPIQAIEHKITDLLPSLRQPQAASQSITSQT